jgi:hypothetical protein
MSESDASKAEPTLVERWLQDQQQWQRTLFTYLDSMMKNDEFLMHMGNAMRGSLLAGKPYPTTPPPAAASADEAATADRLDKVLYALHQLQGQMQDVLMTLDEIRGGKAKELRLKADSTKKRARATRGDAKAIRLKPDSTKKRRARS